MVFCNPCQIETDTFDTSGERGIFNSQYGSGEMKLYYKMWIPSNININSKFKNETTDIPVIVLVHGSGAHDHNEQLGPIQPFRDIARGLCENYDIIVFTYDKRSCGPTASPPCLNNYPPFCELYTNPPNPCVAAFNITYNDLVADAIAAVQYIQKQFPFITAENIIPTGHSQGASIVPWVADYMNLSTAISLMSTGIPIDEVILYQLESSGQENETQIEQDQETFDMIKNGEISGYETVYLLGVPVKAIFWKQWIDAGNSTNRLRHISQLNNYLTLNSDTDWNVPPFTWQPLHELIDKIASNPWCNLHASMNVIPNLVHNMIYFYEANAGIFNVSNDVIDLIGAWSLDSIQMDAFNVVSNCLITTMATTVQPTYTPTTPPTTKQNISTTDDSTTESPMMPTISPTDDSTTTESTMIPTISPTDDEESSAHSNNKDGSGGNAGVILLGTLIGFGGCVLCFIIIALIMVKVCGYTLCKKVDQVETAYTLMHNEGM